MVNEAGESTVVVDPAPWADAPWMVHALNELGQRELPGDAENPRVHAYYASVIGEERSSHLHDDTTPWCSAFANWCMQHYGPGSGSLSARSWTHWGIPSERRMGCVVVFSRPPDPSHGHVAFYTGEHADSLLVLGGNQGNSVSIKPYAKTRVIGYRWPG